MPDPIATFLSQQVGEPRPTGLLGAMLRDTSAKTTPPASAQAASPDVGIEPADAADQRRLLDGETIARGVVRAGGGFAAGLAERIAKSPALSWFPNEASLARAAIPMQPTAEPASGKIGAGEQIGRRLEQNLGVSYAPFKAIPQAVWNLALLDLKRKYERGDATDEERDVLAEYATVQQELQKRGLSGSASVADIAMNIPGFGVEMAVTQPAAVAAKGATKAATGRIGQWLAARKTMQAWATSPTAQRLVASRFGRMAAGTAKVGGWVGEKMVGGLGREFSTFAAGTAADAAARQVGTIQLGPNGVLQWAGNEPALQSIYGALTERVIGWGTEEMGEDIGRVVLKPAAEKMLYGVAKRLGVGSQQAGGLLARTVEAVVSWIDNADDAIKSKLAVLADVSPGSRVLAAKMNVLTSAAHWNGMINEMAEEDAARILSAILGAEYTGGNPKGMLRRLGSAVVESVTSKPLEVAGFGAFDTAVAGASTLAGAADIANAAPTRREIALRQQAAQGGGDARAAEYQLPPLAEQPRELIERVDGALGRLTQQVEPGEAPVVGEALYTAGMVTRDRVLAYVGQGLIHQGPQRARQFRADHPSDEGVRLTVDRALQEFGTTGDVAALAGASDTMQSLAQQTRDEGTEAGAEASQRWQAGANELLQVVREASAQQAVADAEQAQAGLLTEPADDARRRILDQAAAAAETPAPPGQSVGEIKADVVAETQRPAEAPNAEDVRSDTGLAGETGAAVGYGPRASGQGVQLETAAEPEAAAVEQPAQGPPGPAVQLSPRAEELITQANEGVREARRSQDVQRASHLAHSFAEQTGSRVKVRIASSVADSSIPAGVRARMLATLEQKGHGAEEMHAFTDTGAPDFAKHPTVWVMANRFRGRYGGVRLLAKLRHEAVLHGGLRLVLGEKGMRRFAEQVAMQMPEKMLWEFGGQTGDTSMADIGEEVLAYINAEQGLYRQDNKARAALGATLRALRPVAKAFGIQMPVTVAEVNHLLRRGEQKAVGRAPAPDQAGQNVARMIMTAGGQGRAALGDVAETSAPRRLYDPSTPPHAMVYPGEVGIKAGGAVRAGLRPTERTMLRAAANDAVAAGADAPTVEAAYAKAVRAILRARQDYPEPAFELPTLEAAKYVSDDKGIVLKWKAEPWNILRFERGPRAGKLDPMRIQRLARAMAVDIKDVKGRAAAGDEWAIQMVEAMEWYDKLDDVLFRDYGHAVDLLANLLSALSPRTDVRENFVSALEAMRMMLEGQYDDLLAEAAQKVRAQIEATPPGKEPTISITPEEWPMPLKPGGRKFGANSRHVLRVLLGLFRGFAGRDAAKQRQFLLNILGTDDNATVDIWMLRYFRHKMGMKQLNPRSEASMAGTQDDETSEATGEYRMLQQAVAQAARETGETPRRIQGLLWMLEKRRWGLRGWTDRGGTGGDFEYEHRRGLDVSRYVFGYSVSRTKDFRPTEPFVSPEQAAVLQSITDRATKDPSLLVHLHSPAVGTWTTKVKPDAGELPPGGIAVPPPGPAGEVSYSYLERSLATDIMARRDWEPDAVLEHVLRIAKLANQDSVLLARVLTEEDERDVPADQVRPGIEIKFAAPVTWDVAQAMLVLLASEGIKGATVVPDVARRSFNEAPAETGLIAGIRSWSIPEYADKTAPEEVAQENARVGTAVDAVVAQFRAAIDNKKLHQLYGIPLRDAAHLANMRIARRALDILVINREQYDAYLQAIEQRRPEVEAARERVGAEQRRRARVVRKWLSSGATQALEPWDGGPYPYRYVPLRRRYGGDTPAGSGPAVPAGTGKMSVVPESMRPLTAYADAAGMVELHHWSPRSGLPQLRVSAHGTGKPGAEAARRRQSPQWYVPRLYFGYGDYRREEGLGDNHYVAKVRASELYDLMGDPAGLLPKSRLTVGMRGQEPIYGDYDVTLYEKNVKDAGYRGFWNSRAQVAALFEDVPVAAGTSTFGTGHLSAGNGKRWFGYMNKYGGVDAVEENPYKKGEHSAQIPAATLHGMTFVVDRKGNVWWSWQVPDKPIMLDRVERWFAERSIRVVDRQRVEPAEHFEERTGGKLSVGPGIVHDGEAVYPRLADESYRRVVELVPVATLRRMAVHDRSANAPHIEGLAASIARNGWTDVPIPITYSVATRQAWVDESNHRIVAAQRLGLTHLPARVVRVHRGPATAPERVAAVKVKGVEPDRNGYVPADMRPSDVGVAGATQVPETGKLSVGRVTPAQDAAYLAAVERGDTATAKRMVDKVAKQAGWRTAVWHGTEATPIFNVFDTEGWSGEPGFHVATDRRIAELFATGEGEQGGTVMELLLRPGASLRVRDYGVWDAQNIAKQALAAGVLTRGEYASLGLAHWSGGQAEKVVELLRRHGIDSLVYLDRYELPAGLPRPAMSTKELQGLSDVDFRKRSPESTDAYLLFDPSQVKLADPVTRDDAGRVIPLSERFNPASPDVRFSLSRPTLTRAAALMAESDSRQDWDNRMMEEFGTGIAPRLPVMWAYLERQMPEYRRLGGLPTRSAASFAAAQNRPAGPPGAEAAGAARVAQVEAQEARESALAAEIRATARRQTAEEVAAERQAGRARAAQAVEAQRQAAAGQVRRAREQRDRAVEAQAAKIAEVREAAREQRADLIDQLEAERQATQVALATARDAAAMAKARGQEVGALDRKIADLRARAAQATIRWRAERVALELRARQAKQEVRARKAAVVRYARHVLSDRRDFVTVAGLVSKTETHDQLDKAFDRIDELRAARDEREGRADAKAALEKAMSQARGQINSMTGVLHDLLAPTLDGFTPRGLPAAKVRELDASIKHFQANPHQQMPARLVAAIQRAGKVAIADMTAQEMRDLSDAINSLLAQDSLKKKLIGRRRRRTVEQVASSILTTVRSRQRTGSDGEVRYPKAGIWSTVLGQFDNIELLARQLDGADGGPAMVAISDALQGGENNRLVKVEEGLEALRDGLRRRGLDPAVLADWSRRMGSRTPQTVTFRMADGRTVEMDRGQAISLYLTTLDPDGLRHLMSMHGWSITDPAGAHPRDITVPLSAEDVEAIQRTVQSDTQLLAAAEALAEWYDTWSKDTLNAASEELDQYRIAREEHYYPILTNPDWLAGRLHGKHMQFHPQLEGAGMLKERQAQADKPVIVTDAFALFEKHLALAAAYSAFALPMRQIRTILDWKGRGQDRNVELEIMRAHGAQFKNHLLTLIDRVEDNSTELGEAERGISWLMSRTAASILALRPTVWLYQPISYPLAMIDLGAGAVLGKLRPLRPAERRIAEAVLAVAPELRNRLTHGWIARDVAAQYLGNTFLRESLAGRRTLNQMFQLGTKIGDELAIRRILVAAWNKAGQEYAKQRAADPSMPALTPDERAVLAADYAARSVRRTQSTWNVKDRSILMGNPNPAIRMLTMFNSSQEKGVITARHAWLSLAESGFRPGEWGKFLGTMLLLYLWQGRAVMGVRALADWVKTRNTRQPAKRGRQKAEWSMPVATALRTLRAGVSQIPIVGDTMERLVRGVERKQIGQSLRTAELVRSPVIDTGNQALWAAVAAAEMLIPENWRRQKFGQPAKGAQAAWEVADGVAMLTGRVMGVPVEGVPEWWKYVKGTEPKR